MQTRLTRDLYGMGSINRIFVTLLTIFSMLGCAQASSQGGSQVSPDQVRDVKVDEYKLGPEDSLEIYVWKEEDLNKTVVVRPDGAVSFPLVGDLHVAGKTVKQVQAALTERIRKYIPAAVVTVTVTEVKGYKIYVLGKVVNPGEYVLGSYVNIAKALTMADGLTPYASEKNIKVIRNENGKEMVFKFNYARFRKGKDMQRNIVLKSGDVVVVP